MRNRRKILILSLAVVAAVLAFSQFKDLFDSRPWWQRESSLVNVLNNPKYQTPIQDGDAFLFGNTDKDFLAQVKTAAVEKIDGKQSITILQKDFYKGLKIAAAFGDLELIPFSDKENRRQIEGTMYKNSVVYATQDKLVAYLYNQEENELKEFVAMRSFDPTKLYPVGDQGKKEGLAYQWRMVNSTEYRIAYEQGALAFYGPAPLPAEDLSKEGQYAREPEAPKNFLYFKIPAPAVIENLKLKIENLPKAFWEVSGDILSLKVQLNDKAIKQYGNKLLVIDPSIKIGARKVTDPQKQVKDEHTKKLLEEKNIDPNYVELAQDYAKRLTPEEKALKDNDNSKKNDPDPSPYSRTYRDNQTGTYIAEVGGLPMVDTQGNKIEAGWERKGSKYIAKNNLFNSTIKNNSVEIISGSSQPDGREQGDKLQFAPQVFLNGKEQKASKPKLLAIDPINPNYKNNTLEWDYGVAQRRLRIIEGNVLGSWIFKDNPGGDIRIAYNQKGDYKLALSGVEGLKLGQYAINEDEEYMPQIALAKSEYPLSLSYASAFQYGWENKSIAEKPRSLTFDKLLATAKSLLALSRVEGLAFNSSKNPQRPYATAEAQEKFHEELAKQPAGTKKIISPYQEVTNLGNGKFSAEISGLPLTKADLTPIDPVWHKQAEGPDEGGSKYVSGVNLFFAEVNRNKVRIEVGNDQPFDDVKQGDDVTFAPQLLVGGKEYKALKGPTALAVDPMNKNYKNNTLEWDYGVAKRRLRIIEGNIQGSWVFSENPMAEVRIKYNQQGKLALKLGGSSSVAQGTPLKVAVFDNDEEFVSASQFAAADLKYPVSIADSYTFYPDVDAEVTSVDGTVQWLGTVQTLWATVIAAAGTEAFPSSLTEWGVYYQQGGTTGWTTLARSIFLFDTSGLPDSAIVSAATLSFKAEQKIDGASNSPNINIYTSTPASNTNLVAADFQQIGSTAQSTAISYAAFSAGAGIYNDFALNDMTKINLTGVSKLGARNANYDVAALAPTLGSSNAQIGFKPYFSEQGSGFKPKLVVTYTQTSPSTYWPDADPETTSVDGWVGRYNDPATWNDIITGVGTDINTAVNWLNPVYTASSGTTDRWARNTRIIILFDTSGLPDIATISAATFSLYGSSKTNTLSASPAANIYASTPASNTDLVAGDYNQTQTTPFATAITYADWSVSGYNDFTLNADGLAAIKKLAGEVSKFSVKDANYDVAGTPPTWASGVYTQMVSHASEKGATYAPKLVVTYSTWQPRPAGIQPSGGAFLMF